ncbi:MAG: polysaccharide deacetylase family protein [Verrucomicrobium sp.]|nr:polysaccharide deacetylase family protein [Verrucomicrobium sp.]
MRSLVVSLHDVHPESLPLIEEQRQALASWGVARRSLLVVPQFHHGRRADEPAFRAAIDAAQGEGDEVVLHGFYHDRQGCLEDLGTLFWSRFYTNQEAEFLNLEEREARRRLELGLKLFADAGWKPSGFIAPAWLMPPELYALLASLGFSYTNTVRRFVHLPDGRQEASQSLCWSTRAGWRRDCSLIWNELLYPRARRNSLLRISLHPQDLTFPALRAQIERLVKRALDDGFQPVTYADHAAR